MFSQITHRARAGLLLALLFMPLLAGCERPEPEVVIVVTRQAMLLPPTSPVSAGGVAGGAAPPTSPVQAGGDVGNSIYLGTPTPDPVGDSAAAGYSVHVVSAGDTLGYLAQLYESSIAELTEINDLDDSGILAVGQTLRVPAAGAQVGDSFKIIPDSELVYGPAAMDFDVAAFAAEHAGYLMQYQGEIEGAFYSGPEIVQVVADRYSVNPRLLLAALEYQAGWVTDSAAIDNGYPMGNASTGREGLYWQLAWTADQLNLGYYGRSEGGLGGLDMGADGFVAFAPDINDGTAGVQNWLGAGSNVTYAGWQDAIGPDGFYATYAELFGNPFALAVEPLWPANLAQPALQLPWTPGETWYYTGGPHGGWAPSSAWAALDFVPAGERFGCYIADEWVTAMADGVVSRSNHGAVVLDLDGDGYAGTGWAITFMHLEARDRVRAGAVIKAGDRLGHPSCEGGFSDATHVHVARTYNGRWVAADGPISFEMSGWHSEGLGFEYDGLLINADQVREACACYDDELNAILFPETR